MVPDRVGFFLERLDTFIATDHGANAHFQRGLEAYTASAAAREIPQDLADIARGFAIYDFRDSRGRNSVDLYLEAHSKEMSEDEESIWDAIADAAFSLYEVLSVQPGAGLTARCLGQKQTVTIVETTASRNMKPKEILACRVVAYRDHHEFTEVCVLTDAKAYLIRRIRGIFDQSEMDRFLEKIGDPRWLLKSHLQYEDSAGSHFDAKLKMAVELPRLCPGTTMEEVERRVQEMGRSLKTVKLIEGLPFESKEALEKYIELATQLYNWTPQDILGGRSPAEVEKDDPESGLRGALAQDMFFKSAVKTEDWSALSEDDQRKKLKTFVDTWEQTPQDELGGRTPNEVFSKREVPALPPESEWPPPDRPLMTQKKICVKLSHPLPGVRAWALRMLKDCCDFDKGIEKQVLEMTSDPDYRVRLYAGSWISEYADKVSPEIHVEAAKHNKEGKAYRLLYDAAKWAPERTVPLIEKELKSVQRSDKESDFHFFLGLAGTTQAKAILKASSRDPSCFRRLCAASGLYRLGREGFFEATQALAGVCMENRKNREKAYKKCREGKLHFWGSLTDPLELVPVHFIRDELSYFSGENLAEILRMHEIKEPAGFIELFGKKDFLEFRNSWSRRELSSRFITSLTGLLNSALERSEGRNSAGFEELATRIHILADALQAHAIGLARLPSRYIQSFLEHIMAVFLKACHGRLFAQEVEINKHDREALLELNQEDLPFVLDELPAALAAHGASTVAGDLIEWIDNEGAHFGTVRAITTISLLGDDPDLDRESAAATMTGACELEWDYTYGPLESVFTALGDVSLRYLPCASEEEENYDFKAWFYLFIAGTLSTERALFAVRHILPYVRDVVAPRELISSLLCLPHPSFLPVVEALCKSMDEMPWVSKELETFKAVCREEDHALDGQ